MPVQHRQNGLEPATDYKYRVLLKDSDAANGLPPGCGTTNFFTTPDAPERGRVGRRLLHLRGGWALARQLHQPCRESRDGTDRAFTGTGYDTTLAYELPSDTNGCHRSTVAEIKSAALPMDLSINLACSGAATNNIFRAASGGTGQNGEPAQADQLRGVARDKDVDLVVLSIGGNDLGFASIVTACVEAYETLVTATCEESEGPGLVARFPQMRADVGKAIDEVRAVMSGLGYLRSQYPLRPAVLPVGDRASVRAPGARARSSLAHRDRWVPGVCTTPTQTGRGTRSWIRSRTSSRPWPRTRGVQFMDLRDLFQGREICFRAHALASPLQPPSGTTSEWARFLNIAEVVAQGKLQETFHPNAFGQQAVGKCLSH